MLVSLSPAEKPRYNTPDKTLRAARAAVEACESLSGDALAKQHARVKELLDMAAKKNVEAARSKQGVEASQVIHLAKNVAEKSYGQAFSPQPDRRR
jgi:hypothetical protein